MDYERLTKQLTGLPWRDRVFETIGLMAKIVVGGMPTADQFRAMTKVVRDDFEQFIFRGGGSNGSSSILNNPQFARHRDFLNELYLPVMRTIAKKASQNGSTSLSSDDASLSEQSIDGIELMGYLNDLLVDVDDDLLDGWPWLWLQKPRDC